MVASFGKYCFSAFTFQTKKPSQVAVRPPVLLQYTDSTPKSIMGEPTKEERKALKKARKELARKEKQEKEAIVLVETEAAPTSTKKSKKKRKAEEAALAAAAAAATEGEDGHDQSSPSPAATKVRERPKAT